MTKIKAEDKKLVRSELGERRVFRHSSKAWNIEVTPVEWML